MIRSLAAWVLAFAAFVATASATTPPPGHFRIKLGAFEVTALRDGSLDLSASIFRGATPDEIQALLQQSNVAGEKIPTSVNAYLVNTGKKLVLIDVGAGKAFGPTLGRLRKNLEGVGYKPSRIDVICITHLHGDHFGGLLDENGKPAFPNAVVHVPKGDHDRWVAVKPREKAGKPSREGLHARVAAPYLAAGRWKTLADGDEPTPGVRAVAALGHTPGHLTYEVRSEAHTLLVWGDVLHVAAVQLPRPDVFVSFDGDSARAVASRAALLKRLAADQTLVAGAHLPFPGIGRIHAEPTGGYSWSPVRSPKSP